MVEIVFNAEEIARINTLAIKRNYSGEQRGFHSRTQNTSNVWHISGVAGEAAYSRYLNLPMRFEVDSTVAKMHEADVGDKFDIKTARTLEPSNLVINVDHFNESRIYCLANTHAYPNTVQLLGWQDGREIKERAVIKIHKMHGHKIMVYYKELLRPVEELLILR